ncbi:PQQ-binding-like beta-propeller repeat protein [Streptomyces albidus (ex Kaewkla and Franco 2022)]|uniref:outer membrane protein assembly factor BamB family protein n=1 Tax=Streptomyces albidus (ex Kaewkla and Franco 2022) TaxID=722709 RepID=UPI0015EF4EF8|nr:PQQ-binding-like beta-propeller repeat protein [Streptomyces albidus (ex Kaewkla and Franco 2022)]
MQGVGGGNGKAGNGRARALVAAAVAVAIALVAAGFFMVYGDEENGSGKDAASQGRELFKIKAPEVPAGESGVFLRGAWVTDEIYARTTTFGVIGVDPESGERKWRLPLDGLVCNASEHISSAGKTAVLMTESHNARAECTRLVVFDVNSGKKEWQKTMRAGQAAPDSKAGVTISQDVVAVRWAWRGTAAYKVSDGTLLWKAKKDSECVHESLTGGEELTAVVTCDHVVASVDSRVQKLDPETGKPTWEFRIPGAQTFAQVVSSDPMVVQRPRELMVIGEDRELTSTIPLKKHNPGCRTDIESCLSVVVDDRYVYLPSLEHKSGKGSSTNAVVAFDLDTGKAGWKSGAGRDRHIEPLRMEGGKLIAYKKPTYDAGGQIVAIDPVEKGKEQELRLRNPDDREDVEHGFTRTTHVERPLYENGRLYLQWSTLSDNYEDGLGAYVSAAFGPK